jgi:hypothetical protein
VIGYGMARKETKGGIGFREYKDFTSGVHVIYGMGDKTTPYGG